ncbi:MAG: transcriptional regulator [Thermoprotei archaeon]|nr:MAG: transcriptional regulator [Thermoprotei archaeon]
MSVKVRSVPRVWREIKIKYRLIGGKCPNCGKSFYPYRDNCPYCGFKGAKEVELPREGKVITYTVIRAPPADFTQYAPYPIALVELKDGTRVIAQLTDVNIEDIRTGMSVEAVFRKYREQGEDGIIEYGIKFRPLLKS